MTGAPLQAYISRAGTFKAVGRPNLGASVGGIPARSGFTAFLNEQFTNSTLDPAKYHLYKDSVDGHFGGTTRIQAYDYANVSVGTGSAGSTDGKSLKMTVTETDAGSGTLPDGGSAGTRYSYKSGMFDTKNAGFYLPLYFYGLTRCKIPHGQGFWPAWWYTAKNGGAGMVELDKIEYFHAEVPGRLSYTIHSKDNSGTFKSNRYTNNGSSANGGGPVRSPFETPTYTPAWHDVAVEVVPVTSSSGTTLGDPSQPSTNVRFSIYLDGSLSWQIVDTQALYWTTNGGDINSFWNVYGQGCQVDGDFIGHPRDALGYSHWAPPIVSSGPKCLISGSPGSCSTVASDGKTVLRAQFDGTANVFEADHFQVSQYTG